MDWRIDGLLDCWISGLMDFWIIGFCIGVLVNNEDVQLGQ